MIRMIQPLANMSKATRWLAPLAKALFPARLGPDQHVTSMWPKHGRSTQVENRDTAHWHNPIPLGMVEVLSSMGYCHITHYRNSFINSMIGTHSISQMWLKSELLCAKATVYSPLVFITRCGRLRCFSFVQTNDNDKRIDLLFPKHNPQQQIITPRLYNKAYKWWISNKSSIFDFQISGPFGECYLLPTSPHQPQPLPPAWVDPLNSVGSTGTSVSTCWGVSPVFPRMRGCIFPLLLGGGCFTQNVWTYLLHI